MKKRLLISVFSVVAYPCLASQSFFIPATTFTVEHDRTDLKLGKLWIHFACFQEDGSWLNGDCVRISRKGSHVSDLVEFTSQHMENWLQTEPLVVTFDARKAKFFCLGMKVLFWGHPNQTDFELYKHPEDRYSVLSYCSLKDLPPTVESQPRFSHRRVNSSEDLVSAFSNPIRLDLKAKAD